MLDTKIYKRTHSQYIILNCVSTVCPSGLAVKGVGLLPLDY